MYLVKFKYSFQVSPNDWDYTSVEGLFDKTATIEDIKNWVGGKIGFKTDKPFTLFEVQLSQPETY